MESWATYHLTNDANDGKPYFGSYYITIGDGNSVPIKQVGQSHVSTNSGSHFVLHNVLHALNISHNLAFMHKFCQDNNVLVKFYSNTFWVKKELTKRILV